MSRSIEKSVSRTVWENSTNKTSKDTIACETPVALVYNGICLLYTSDAADE